MNDTELRQLQDKYVDFVLSLNIGINENTVVDCRFPVIRTRDLRTNLYPQLKNVMTENLRLYGNLPPKPATVEQLPDLPGVQFAETEGNPL